MGKGLNPYSLKSFLSWQKLGIRIGAIALAGLLWLFVVSENKYTMVTDMPIEARNLPARHALGEEVPDFAKVRLKGTGRNLFKTIILKQFIPDFKLVLDLERISEEYDFILNDYFERYPQKVAIPSNFDVEYVEVIYPSSIHISLDEYKEKMVAVDPRLLIHPAPGYILVGKSNVSPQTVKIAGSRNIVEEIGGFFPEVYSKLIWALPVRRGNRNIRNFPKPHFLWESWTWGVKILRCSLFRRLGSFSSNSWKG